MISLETLDHVTHVLVGIFRIDDRVEHELIGLSQRPVKVLLRLREAGGATFWEVSSDATSWTGIARQSTPSEIDAADIRLTAADEGGVLDTTASFAHVLGCR